MNREYDVSVFAAQVFGKVEQKRADCGKGFVAVGDEAFGTGVGSDGKQRGWVICGFGHTRNS